MNQIYNAFDAVFSVGASELQSYAISLFWILATIDFTWTFGMATLENACGSGTSSLSLLVRKIMCYGAIVWLIRDYSSMITAVMEGFVQIGSIIGGGGSGITEIDPESIFNMGVTVFGQVSSNFAGMVVDGTVEGAKVGIKSALASLPFAGGTGLGGIALGAGGGAVFALISVFIIALAIFVCFAMLALQLCLTLLEFKIIGSYIIILLPFLVFKPLSFLGEKGINVLISFGVKLSVIMAIATGLGKVIPLLDSMNVDSGSFEYLAIYLGGLLIITWLAWQTSALTASLMSGGTSLTAGGIIRSGVAAAGAAVALGTAAAVGGSQGLDVMKGSIGKSAATAASSGNTASASSGSSAYGRSSYGSSSSGNSSSSNDSSTDLSSMPCLLSPADIAKASRGSGSNAGNSSSSSDSSNKKNDSKTNANQENSNPDSSGDEYESIDLSSMPCLLTPESVGRASGGSSSSTASNSGSSPSSGNSFSSGSVVNGQVVGNPSTSDLGSKIKSVGNSMQNVLEETNKLIPEEESPQ